LLAAAGRPRGATGGPPGDTPYPGCAGPDVPTRNAAARVRLRTPGRDLRQEVRTVPATTRGLLALPDWSAEHGVTHAARESTGVSWRPVHHLPEGRVEPLLVNARATKQAPGRKTDVTDRHRIARLPARGLPRPGFVPPPAQRESRELTRRRVRLAEERAAANRIRELPEDARRKPGDVLSDVPGRSGRDLLRARAGGQAGPRAPAESARGRARAESPQREPAREGRVRETRRSLPGLLLDHVEWPERLIGRLEARVGGRLPPVEEAVERRTTIPGVDRRTAAVVAAEGGADGGRFPSAGHLASRAGLCPGSNESAGQRRSGRTCQGGAGRRRALAQAAWAASRTRRSRRSARYRRLAARRGRKRALAAVAPTLPGVRYRVLKRRTT
jgi:transposase